MRLSTTAALLILSQIQLESSGLNSKTLASGYLSLAANSYPMNCWTAFFPWYLVLFWDHSWLQTKRSTGVIDYPSWVLFHKTYSNSFHIFRIQSKMLHWFSSVLAYLSHLIWLSWVHLFLFLQSRSHAVDSSVWLARL